MRWEVIGVAIGVLSLAGGAGGYLLNRGRRIRAQEPRIVFGDLHFAGPREHSRAAYAFAIGGRITNVGGTALQLTWSYLDPRQQWHAEFVSRPSLGPHESTDDWMGIRGTEQSHDPTEAEAREFYLRCMAFVTCWDARRDHWVFSPNKAGRIPELHGDPVALRKHLSQYPSRGDTRRSLGLGETEAGSADEADE